MKIDFCQLKDRYAQYQKQFNLQQITKLTVDTIEYGVINAVGDKVTGDVTITLCAINQGYKDDDIQLAGAELTDFDGNQKTDGWLYILFPMRVKAMKLISSNVNQLKVFWILPKQSHQSSCV